MGHRQLAIFLFMIMQGTPLQQSSELGVATRSRVAWSCHNSF